MLRDVVEHGRDVPPRLRQRAARHGRNWGWYKAHVNRFGKTIAALLLTVVATAAVGFGACMEPCSDLFADCSALCLDCNCCPNGVSTPFEVPQPDVTYSPSVRVSQATFASHLSVPQAEILHVPKQTLA